MNEQQRKTILKETFDTVAPGYDSRPLRFFPESARQLAACLDLRGDETVLDVATGTGHAALAVATRVPRGRVTGVDFSTGMLDQAARKAASLNIRNVDFLERDMEDLGFPAGCFDAAICSFGIFFAMDMAAQLSRIAQTVRPGGQVALSGFQENYFHPLKDLMVKRLSGYGVEPPPPNWKRIATEAGCKELFAKAGMDDVRVELRNVGYFLDNADAWWEVVWNAGFRRLISPLPPEDRERFKREHLQEVAGLATKDGIWLDVGVLFAIGTKPGR
ncbi:MAG: class I SAM-dependent methyltransferase [Nitrospirota bacterium]